MKKYLYFSAVLFIAALTSFSLVSCGDDDDETTPQKEPKAVAAEVSYSMYLTPSVANYITVEAEYTDLDGQTQTATLSERPTVKDNADYHVVTISWDYQNLPFAETISFRFTPKADIELPEKVDFGIATEGTINVKYDNGTTLASRITGYSQNGSGAIFEKLVESLNKNYGTATIELDSEGQLVK